MKYITLLSILWGCSDAKSLEDTATETDTDTDTDSDTDTDTDADNPMDYVVINEICSEASATEDWIEFYNSGSVNADLSGTVIGDNVDEMVLVSDLSAELIVPAGGFLVVYTETEDGVGFGIKKDGSETLYFALTEVAPALSFEVPTSEGEDLSYGRLRDGGDNWENGMIGTPGASNAQ